VGQNTDKKNDYPLKLAATCAFGLEALVKRELAALGFEPRVAQPGRVSFGGDWADVVRSNLWLRTADRVLLEVLRFPAPDFDTLFDTVREFDWGSLLPANACFPVTARSQRSQLTSVPAIQRSVKRAVADSLMREHATTTLREQGPLYKLHAALLDDEVSLTIDTSGPGLHKRGYRKLTGAAPLKETLAAALVILSVWNPDRPLADPFCGSGTIPVEAALLGLNMPPGGKRDFAFTAWPQIPRDLQQSIRQHALQQRREDVQLQILGTDHDAEALSMARYHAGQAGVGEHIHFQQKSFNEFRSKRLWGCLITNPPWGERLQDTESLLPLYRSIPAVFQRVPTWSLYVLTNMPRFEAIVQKQADRRRKLFNGRIECTYYQFLGPRPPRPSADEGNSDVGDNASLTTPPATSELASQAVFDGLQSPDHAQAGLFRNRLTKRARHLRRWPTRRQVTCFRLYDRDIPEIPLVVDRYDDFLHITRYERPHDRPLARDAAWLELMARTAAETLDVPIQHVHVKQRRQKVQQHPKLDNRGKRVPVRERDLQFLVNLTDYVDTGLFLDHRELRQMVRERAADRDFLNLFGYTGAFSVYAAAGQARSTTTVDLSRNYLAWALQNMQLNGLQGMQHRFIASDVL
jgi:23S rRNA (guanine2445-N2)-methyltransferase / 23S rRNA (guanine2069-N7)-methyltransferase